MDSNNKKKRTVQLMVVSSSGDQVVNRRISRRSYMLLASSVVTGLVILVGAIAAGGYILWNGSPFSSLVDENRRLTKELLATQQTIEHHQQTYEAIGAVMHTMKTMIGPEGENATYASKKIQSADGERTRSISEGLESDLGARLARLSQERLWLDSIGEEAKLTADELRVMLTEEPELIQALPSIRPVESELPHSPFGPRMNAHTEKLEVHKGVDFNVPLGSDVRATAGGTVVFSGQRGDYGRAVILSHRLGYQTYYAHLDSYKVRPGDEVKRGDVIGRSGNSGRTTGPHLHYEVRHKGMPQDPELFFLEDLVESAGLAAAAEKAHGG